MSDMLSGLWILTIASFQLGRLSFLITSSDNHSSKFGICFKHSWISLDIKSIFIVNRPTDGQGPLQPESIDAGSDIINISNPKWDSGMKNKQISIKAPGFVTLKGSVNVNNAETVGRLNICVVAMLYMIRLNQSLKLLII